MYFICRRAALCLFAPLLCIPASLPTAVLAAENMTQLSFIGDGEAYQLVLNGTHGYLASGSFVKILDLIDPRSPSEEGLIRVPSNSALAALVVGGYLCLGGAEGLDLYALTNPSSPVLASSYHDGKVTRLVKTGPDRVYAGGSGFWIYETLGPGSLVLEGTWTDPSLVCVTDIDIVGNYVYLGILERVIDYDVIYSKPQLIVLDISHPDAPVEVLRWDSNEGAPGGALAVSGNSVYFGYGQTLVQLFVFLGSSSYVYPTNTFTTDGWINDVIIDGERLILDTTSGLRIYENQNLLASLDISAWGKWLTQSENLLYRPGRERGLDVIDIQDATHPQLVSHLNRPTRVDYITLDGTLAYVSAETFFIMDVADPATPRVVKEIQIPAGRSIADGDRLYVVTYPDRRYPNPDPYRVVVFDRSDPGDPHELGHVDSPTQISDFCETGGRVYAAAYRSLEVYDCRDPLDASLIASLPLGHQTSQIARYGYYLYMGGYVADGSKIDALIVKNPLRPRIVRTLSMPGDVRDVYTCGNLLYVSNTNTGLKTFDLSTPKNPTLLDTRPNPARATHRWQTWVAQALYPGGVSVFDGTNPANPIEIASHEGPVNNYAYDLAIQGSLVVVGYTEGLATYRIEDVATVPKPEAAPVASILEISPNPLRQGVASLGVTIPESGHASITAYDIEGRVVRSWEIAGAAGSTQNIQWDGNSSEGRRLAKGMYFVRLIAGETDVTQRMLIVR